MFLWVYSSVDTVYSYFNELGISDHNTPRKGLVREQRQQIVRISFPFVCQFHAAPHVAGSSLTWAPDQCSSLGIETPSRAMTHIFYHNLWWWWPSAELGSWNLADGSGSPSNQGVRAIVRKCQELVILESVFDTVLICRRAGIYKISEVGFDLHLLELVFYPSVVTVSCHRRMSSRKVSKLHLIDLDISVCYLLFW